tara:strand:+ start:1119 stop:1541 length:423 start_codon:yes stop_codon:yes gene_type:complete
MTIEPTPAVVEPQNELTPLGSATPALIEDPFPDTNDLRGLRSLRDSIIMNEKIEKHSALLISSLCNASELMLLDTQFKKDTEIQAIRHELALLHARVSERDMLQSLCSDIRKLSTTVEENVKQIEDLVSRVTQLTHLKKR